MFQDARMIKQLGMCYDKMLVLCKDCHVILRITWSVKVLQ